MVEPEGKDVELPYVLQYPVNDKNIGVYTQVVKCETLDAVLNYIKLLKEKQKD